MNKEENIAYWINSADDDLLAAESLFASKQFLWCLFIGHLVLEKALKALIVYRTNQLVPPKIHNLTKLAKIAGFDLDENINNFFDDINLFQIEARYPKYKKEAYKTANQDFTTDKFDEIKRIYLWLKSQIQL
jgi:HEPN domain-containing protein